MNEPRSLPARRLLSGPGTTPLKRTLLASYVAHRHKLGDGYDILNGQVASPALKPFALQTGSNQIITENVRSVATEQEMELEFGLALGGDGEVEGVDVGGSVEYLHHVEASNESLSLILHWASEDSGIALAAATQYEASPAALSLFQQQGQGAFERKYGQYYVAGYRYGSRFHAVYRCRSNHAGRFDSFRAELSASVPDLAGATAAADFASLAASHSVSVSISIHMVGVPQGAHPPPTTNLTPREVVSALNWFKSNHSAVPIEAELQSYGYLDLVPGFTNRLQVPSDLLTRAELVYQNYWRIGFLERSLSKFYRSKYDSTVRSLLTGIERDQGRFLSDGQLVDSYYLQTTDMIQTLQGLDSRERLVAEIHSTQPGRHEPPKGARVHETTRNDRRFGLTEFSAEEQAWVETTEVRVEKNWSVDVFAATGEFTRHFSGRVVVGWKLSSNRRDNGYWWKEGQDLLVYSNRVSLHFIGQGFDKIDYSITVYTVDAAEFDLGSVGLPERKATAESRVPE